MRPAETVIAAYYRRRGEDRVTEVFATILDQSRELLEGVIALAGLPVADTYDIQTQVKSGNVTIDLQVRALDADGADVWLLWSEHKVNDRLTARQLQNEYVAITARAGSLPCRLVAITLFSPTSEAIAFAAGGDCALLRWSSVTDVARRTRDRTPGLRHGSATVADLVLAEWLAFAKEELEAPMEALTPDQVRWLPEAERALDTLEHLLLAGFSRACVELGAGIPRDVDGELHAAPPDNSWLTDKGFRLYAKYEPDGFGDVDGPCLVVGAWIDENDAVSARRSHEFHHAFDGRGLAIWDEEGRHGGWIEFGLAISLAELAQHSSLEEQDEVFGATCRRALDAIAKPI